jgi:hypothetical protein
MEFEIQFARDGDTQARQFHIGCFEAWEFERTRPCAVAFSISVEPRADRHPPSSAFSGRVEINARSQ